MYEHTCFPLCPHHYWMLTNVLATANLINEKIPLNIKICILKVLVNLVTFSYIYWPLYILCCESDLSPCRKFSHEKNSFSYH